MKKSKSSHPVMPAYGYYPSSHPVMPAYGYYPSSHPVMPAYGYYPSSVSSPYQMSATPR